MRATAKRLLRRIGVDVRPYTAARVPERRRGDFIHALGIGLVLDVGANRGNWSRELREDGYRGRIICFEPLADAFEAISESEKIRVALGDHDGTAPLNIAGNSESSSLRPMADRHVAAAPRSAYVAAEEVVVKRLDSFGLTDPLYLKIDAQGFEREILAGAEQTLAVCLAIEVELSLVELYEGQALAREVMDFTHDRGFRPIAIWDSYIDARTREVLQVNAIVARLDHQ